jgi:hypothetical protein
VLRCVHDPEWTKNRDSTLCPTSSNILNIQSEALTDAVNNRCLDSNVLWKKLGRFYSICLAIDSISSIPFFSVQSKVDFPFHLRSSRFLPAITTENLRILRNLHQTLSSAVGTISK